MYRTSRVVKHTSRFVFCGFPSPAPPDVALPCHGGRASLPGTHLVLEAGLVYPSGAQRWARQPVAGDASRSSWENDMVAVDGVIHGYSWLGLMVIKTS